MGTSQYNQFMSGDHGVVSGLPNIVLLFMCLAFLFIVILIVVLLARHQKRKQEEENIQKFGRKVRTNRVTDGSFDPEKEVMEDIEGELEKYIELKEKLTAYLSYLNTREGADIKVADSNRLKYKVKNALSAKFGLNMDEDGEESAYYERKRKDMIGQLGKAMGGNKPRGDGAVRKNNFMS